MNFYYCLETEFYISLERYNIDFESTVLHRHIDVLLLSNKEGNITFQAFVLIVIDCPLQGLLYVTAVHILTQFIGAYDDNCNIQSLHMSVFLKCG